MSVTTTETMVAQQRDAEAPLFVINLCASTTPVALTPPSTPELKRFNFFVTRQREDGRERFRLHMGYFASQEEAETVLTAVRDVYPAAWTGPAPNNRAAAVRARMPQVPVSVPPAVAAGAVVPAPLAAPEAPAVATAVQAAKPVAAKPATAKAAAAKPAPVKPAATKAATTKAADAKAVEPKPAAAKAVEAKPVAAKPVAAKPAAAKPAAVMPAAVPVRPEPVATASPQSEETLDAMSNVREVLAELDDEAPRAAAAPASRAPAEPVLTPAQTLSVLEAPARLAEPGNAAAADIRVITPEDTQTLRDISLDAQNSAPPSFAVQLSWSVTPIDVEDLPHLAIFDAYTLYNVEGNRQGRRWYGLRLGFFSDPDAARQVAHYVRSDYASVAVVPVTVRERERATGAVPSAVSASGTFAAPLLRAAAPAATVAKLDEPRSDTFKGFELLNDDRPAAPKRDVDEVAPAAGQPPVLKPALRPAAVAAAAKPAGKRAVARKPRPVMPGAPQPLEETLEMLGASTLTLDESREVIREPLSRESPKKPAKGPGARFARLLTRLSSRG